MLEPGRELDTLVAEKVMGLNIPWDENTTCPKCGAEMRYCGNRSRCFDCYEWVYGPYKEYSTDIAAAWEVVEAADIGCLYRDNVRRWCAVIGGYGRLEGVPGETVPHAICLAALKAKGVDIG